MEKITKALIDEINDITTYADLINLQKIIFTEIVIFFLEDHKCKYFIFDYTNSL